MFLWHLAPVGVLVPVPVQVSGLAPGPAKVAGLAGLLAQRARPS